MKKLLDKTKKFKGEHERELANPIIDVALKSNKALLEELKVQLINVNSKNEKS